MVKVYLSNGYFEDLTENSREKGRKMIVKGFFGSVRNILRKYLVECEMKWSFLFV